jgi:hypothetical protein
MLQPQRRFQRERSHVTAPLFCSGGNLHRWVNIQLHVMHSADVDNDIYGFPTIGISVHLEETIALKYATSTWIYMYSDVYEYIGILWNLLYPE